MVRHARNDSPSKGRSLLKFLNLASTPYLFSSNNLKKFQPPPQTSPKTFFTPKCLGQFVIINEFQHSTLFSSKASIIFEFVPLFVVVHTWRIYTRTIIYAIIPLQMIIRERREEPVSLSEHQWALKRETSHRHRTYLFMFNRSSCCVYLRHVIHNFPWNTHYNWIG